MTISVTQSAVGNYAFGASATFTNPPTEGNLLIAATSHRDAQNTASYAGWDLIFQEDSLPGDGTFRRALAVFAKIAEAGESSTVNPTWTGGISYTVIAVELETDVGAWDAVTSAVSASSNNGAVSNGETTPTGTTAVTANQLVALFGVWKDGGSGGGLTHSVPGYALAVQYPTGAFELDTSILWDEVADSAARSETINISGGNGNNSGLTGGIAVFGFTGAAGPVITDIDGDNQVIQGQTNVAHNGTDFGVTQGTGTLIYSDNAVFGAGTEVTQTISTWNDTQIVSASAVFPGTVGIGDTCYAYVTDDGGTTSDAFAFTRAASSVTATVRIAGGANLTGLAYTVFDGYDMGTSPILKQGNDETTDADGDLTIDLVGTGASNGDPVTIVVSDYTTSPSAASSGAVCYTGVTVAGA